MTSQSLPISRTNKDYILSGIVVVLLAGAATLSIYLTRPNALVMRQPRMTVIIGLAATMLVTAFIFIGRPALPFFSRPLAWGSVAVSGISAGALAYFTTAGTSSSWFRFAILCLVLTGGATVLSEIMIFYRRVISDRAWKNAIWHKVLFALVIAGMTFAMVFFYYDKAVSGGAVLDYGTPNFEIPDTSTELPSDLGDLGNLGDTTTTLPIAPSAPVEITTP